MSNENKLPEKKYRAGQVTGTIWKNTTEKDGNEIVFYNTTIVRSYKDGDEWKETNSFGKHDLPNLRLISEKCFEFMAFKEEEVKAKAKEE